MTHTPTPWQAAGNHSEWVVRASDGALIATLIGNDGDANAALIFRACNAWNDPDALLARLHELSEADEARRYQRTPQQEQELEVMRSRREI